MDLKIFFFSCNQSSINSIKPLIKFNWVHKHLILYFSSSNKIFFINSALTSQWYTYYQIPIFIFFFEPPQLFFGHFLGALTSSFHCYIFLIYYYLLIFFCIFFACVGNQKCVTTKVKINLKRVYFNYPF